MLNYLGTFPSLSETRSEIRMEHQGGAWATVPQIGEECRIALTVPLLHGQDVDVNIRTLLRYELMAEWLGGMRPSPKTLRNLAVTFRPFYTADEPPLVVRQPFALAAADRLIFTVPHSPDQADSRDNLLTATRTGFRHLGLRFWEQPADIDVLKGVLRSRRR